MVQAGNSTQAESFGKRVENQDFFFGGEGTAFRSGGEDLDAGFAAQFSRSAPIVAEADNGFGLVTGQA